MSSMDKPTGWYNDDWIEARIMCSDLITPWNVDQLQPASYDLTLGDEFTIPIDGQTIDLTRPNNISYMRYRNVDEIKLKPHEFMLAHTVETINCEPDTVGIVMGKSSIARMGLQVEAAGLVDPGFSGQITLELTNMTSNTLILRPGMRIAQIGFQLMTAPAVQHYGCLNIGSHYQYQTGATPARGDQPDKEVR